MGNAKSKKTQKEPDKFFERERWKEQKREEKRKKLASRALANKRAGKLTGTPPVLTMTSDAASAPGPSAAPPGNVRSYDDEALDRMRYQLNHDSEAFLLNNILLSIQFFENYEREVSHIKSNPINENEQIIEQAVVRLNKHVFFADRLQECVHEHVGFQRVKGTATEPLSPPRLFVIYDNVEASEPGDTSDYSAVLDAPFYKLQIEDCKEPGYLKLRQSEVLESTLTKEAENDGASSGIPSNDSIFTDSEKESYCDSDHDNDDDDDVSKGQELLQKLESKLLKSKINHGNYLLKNNIHINNVVDVSERRRSGPIKQLSHQSAKSIINNIEIFRKENTPLVEINDSLKKDPIEDNEIKSRKSILKTNRRPSGPVRELKNKTHIADIRKASSESMLAEDTETSGYRSTGSSRQNESSETESDYGYSTITESTTPKKLALSVSSTHAVTSGVLPDECWTPVQVKAVDSWSDDDEDDELEESSSKVSTSRNLYETIHYLSSQYFMNNFVDNFIINLGPALGVTKENISSALTQGASIYCDTMQNGTTMKNEVFPALLAAWPNSANPWIIRERKIIINPRTNHSYQWPTKYMVNKAIGFGCLLAPVGFRPKRGVNPDQSLQWRVLFPAAERYLESCLAHSHMRCYLFALVLHKTFIENENSKVGIDAQHIKNHLFWQCEDNYARWPEDRLGEALRLFLRTFYVHFGQARFPNYFVESCNDFKSIPKPVLHKQQRRLADILESPVMHMLKAIDKLKYMKRDYYPTFNSHKLHEILTTRNPLRIINPGLPTLIPNNIVSSDSDDDREDNVWDKTKAQDKHYQWKKERQRQIQERRKVVYQNKKQKASIKQTAEINTKIILPSKIETERRRLVLEFFISHFIAMARSSEKFDAIRQAVIYLEQAKRLSLLLLDEPGGEITANEYMDVIRDKLADCQRKLVNQGGFKLPPRRESQVDRHVNKGYFAKMRPRYDQIISQNSPTDSNQVFSFVDVHTPNAKYREDGDGSKLILEESKL